MIRVSAALLCLVSAIAVGVALRAQPAEKDGVVELLHEIEAIVQSGETPKFFALLSDSADRERARSFAEFEFPAATTRAVIQERDRVPLQGALPGNGYRLMADVFTESGSRARVATWRLDVK